MADQYKDLETPEEAFAALLAQSKGGPVVEWLEDCQWSRVITPEAWKVVDVCQLNFRVPLPPVVTVVYHVHSVLDGSHRFQTTYYLDQARSYCAGGEHFYIVKHTVTNGVPAVEVVK